MTFSCQNSECHFHVIFTQMYFANIRWRAELKTLSGADSIIILKIFHVGLSLVTTFFIAVLLLSVTNSYSSVIFVIHSNQTRLPSNLRPTTRECMHLLTRSHFPSRDKDGGHTVRFAIPTGALLGRQRPSSEQRQLPIWRYYGRR